MKTTESKAIILDGLPVARSVTDDLIRKIKQYSDGGARKPALAVILVGDNSASEVYVKNKIRTCGEIGITSYLQRYDSNVDKSQIINGLAKLNADDTIDGILVQLPLPKHLLEEEILNAIAPDKDVDGLHPYNLGLLFAGRTGLQPCTPKGIMALLAHYQIAIEGKSAVVVGRSNLVGKPIAAMLLQKNATVTICHSRTVKLQSICQEADILIVAAGQKQLVDKNWVKPGACVIDVGIHREINSQGKATIVGDVLFEDVKSIAGYITPVPGGVGKMTVAMLMSNTVFAYEQHLGLAQK